MSTLTDIRAEIERLTERRSELFTLLSQGHDAALAAEHAALEERIKKLWDDQRVARARLVFGEREKIISRARQEERLERAA
jgi:hypothetical protein